MKILILSFYFYPDLSAGSFRTTSLAKELKNIIKDTDNVDILTTQPNRYCSFNIDAPNFEKFEENINIYRLDLGTHKSGFVDQSFLFLKYAYKCLKILKDKKDYDIVYATSSKLMTAFLGSIISKKYKSKLYLDMRDIFTDTLESIFCNSKIRYIIPFFKAIEKYTINSANHINLVSKGFEEYFKKINNNITYSFYTNGIDDIFLEYDFSKQTPTQKKIFTYAGNIGEGQGLEKIIPDIARYLGDDYEVHVYGDGGRKSIFIEKISSIKNIKLFAPINRDELLKVYKNSDILFLHLNDYEAFKKVLPSKVFEYGATDKFIIAGVGGYAKEFIDENLVNSFTFEPCNIKEFIEKFENTKDSQISRVDFKNKFNRKNIMSSLTKELYELT